MWSINRYISATAGLFDVGQPSRRMQTLLLQSKHSLTDIAYRLVTGTWLELEQHLLSLVTSQFTGVGASMASHQVDDRHFSNLCLVSQLYNTSSGR